MPTLLNKALRLFLDSIGKREEYEFYLEKFSGHAAPAFALICPERAGFEDMAAALTFDLDALRRLELHPTVVLCGEQAGEMHDLLVTGDHPYAVFDLAGLGSDLSGTAATDITGFIESAENSKKVAVLVTAAHTRETLLGAFVPALSRRVHILRARGPLHEADGTLLNYYYTNRSSVTQLAEEDREVARLAAGVLDVFPGAHFSVCTPWNLLQELFTVKGAGCIIRQASTILQARTPDEIDAGRLLELLRESFGRAPLAGRVFEHCTHYYVEEHYRGAVLLETHAAGAYMSKFAVGTQARGEGLGNELWREISRDHPALFWRARPDNPINQWYERRALGHHSLKDWRVYWRGLNPDNIPAAIRYCTSRPDDFES